MRNYTLNIRLAAVMVAPLLLACGSNNTGGGGFVTIPDCGGGSNQVLTTDSTGQLVCKVLPAGAVKLPDCKPDVEALTSDGTNLLCAPRNTVDATTQTYLDTLTMIEKQVMDYGTQITKIGAGPGAQAVYQGLTKTSTTGRITSGNATPGIAAATAMCATDYGAGAHMCTPYEIYYSAALLKGLDTTTAIGGGGWVYMQSWKTPGGTAIAATLEPTAGLADNCAGYTSQTAGGAGTNQLTGTVFRYTLSTYNNMALVPKFFADTSCATSLPVACCK